MPLSRKMHETLAVRFPVERPRPAGTEVGQKFSRWFCPGCGTPLGQGMVCGQCGKSIHDQEYGLVEFHPHAPD